MMRPKRRAFMPGEDGLGEEERGFDEELELVKVGLPGLVFDGQAGLVAGGVEDEDVDGVLVMRLDCGDEALDFCFIADVGLEGVGFEVAGADLLAEGFGAGGGCEVVDGDVVTSFGRGRWPWRIPGHGRSR